MAMNETARTCAFGRMAWLSGEAEEDPAGGPIAPNPDPNWGGAYPKSRRSHHPSKLTSNIKAI